MNISDVDKNFKIQTALTEKDIVFYDVKNDPFRVYGLYDYKNQASFKRLPDELAEKLNEGARITYLHTAGGRVRFKTDSPYIALHAGISIKWIMPHMPLSGQAGFDMFCEENGKNTYIHSFMPPSACENFEGVIHFPERKMRDITINFPLYNSLDSLNIGLSADATLLPPEEYRHKKPVVFYGSSITQGGCASRPGNSYQAMISRMLDTDYINLGFSGGCKAEPELADYMAELDMSVFVFDYDHNAPDAEYLKRTHSQFFSKIREKNPSLPIIMLSKPGAHNPDAPERLEVIRDTYRTAVEGGDKNVYLIEGKTLFEEDYNLCTVDGTHPNDLGFYKMANRIAPFIARVL